MSLTWTILAVMAGAAGGVVGWLLSSDTVTRRRRIGSLLVVAAALSAAGIVGIVALVGMLLFGDLDFFGVTHLAYVGACLSVPIVGLAVGAHVITGRAASVVRAGVRRSPVARSDRRSVPGIVDRAGSARAGHA